MIDQKIMELFEKIMKTPCISYEKLNNSRTNSIYKIISQSGTYILRIPGKGTNEYINRRNEIYNLNEVHKLGFVPKIYYANVKTGLLILEYIENSISLTREDLKDPKRLKMVCELLVKLHTSDTRMINEFDLIATKNHYIRRLNELGAKLPIELKEQISMLEDMMMRLEQEYPKKYVPCHGDIRPENFLLNDDGLWLIDWEYSGMADVCFELMGMNLSGGEEERFLEEYQYCSGQKIDRRKYLLYKIATDYMWIFWHLIKLSQKQMVEYNDSSWRVRLNRACKNVIELEELS